MTKILYFILSHFFLLLYRFASEQEIEGESERESERETDRDRHRSRHGARARRDVIRTFSWDAENNVIISHESKGL